MSQEKQSNVFIECVGAPGSGKTTLVDRLVKEYGFVTPPVNVQHRDGLRFFFRHKRVCLLWFFSLLKETVQTNSWNLFRFKSAVFINSIGRMYLAEELHKRGHDVAVDEGFFQRLLSLYEHVQPDHIYAKWCRVAPVEHYVVCVESSTASIGKLGTYRKSLGEDYARRWLDVAVSNSATLRKNLVVHATSQTLVFSRERDPIERLVRQALKVAA
jgi:hypothetical protein